MDASPIESDKNTAGDRAAAIAALYFPALRPEMAALEKAILTHMEFVSAELQTMGREGKTYADGAAKTAAGRMAQALVPLIEARKALTRRARKMMEEELFSLG